MKDLSSGGREQLSFEINFEPAPEQLGQYSLRISLGQERRATTLGPIAVR